MDTSNNRSKAEKYYQKLAKLMKNEKITYRCSIPINTKF